MSTPRGSRKIEAATRRLESARSRVLSAWAEREAWTAQCAGLKRSIDELQRTRDELKKIWDETIHPHLIKLKAEAAKLVDEVIAPWRDERELGTPEEQWRRARLPDRVS